MFEFDLQQIYTELASYKGLPFPIGLNQLPDYKIRQIDNRIGIINGERDVKSIYGLPVICPVTIGDVILGSGADESKHITIQPIVVFGGKKKIVMNDIGGGQISGSIKEFINYDDYTINITGVLVNRNQKLYPHDQKDILLDKIWLPNVAQKFDCAITNDLFGYIVVKRIKFKGLTKSPGLQMYEIEAVSDSVVEVELLTGN